MEKVFLNGSLMPASEAKIDIDDSSFLYGIGLFETMRAAGGRVFRLDDHLQRLMMSAQTLAIVCSYSTAMIRHGVEQVLQANGLSDARIRLTLTSGPLRTEEEPRSTLLITATEFVPYSKDYFEKGVRVVITDYRQNPKDPFVGHKTTCFGPRLAALRAAHEKLAAEALWFTTENRLAEGCLSNVFLVCGGRLLTPPLSTPVLGGIARKTVLELARQEKIPFEERPLDINDLLSAEEVFLTNVIMTILPVIAVEGHTVAEGKPGPITKRLMEKYEEQLKGRKTDETIAGN
ncbi:MAG TPA: aminotransferase class IV [Anaerohalosphaeraceae bacterium]|nr:aminotransferase class IV [Anaerohalosphaeraceae bacterium]HPB93270.1 aminotransferase class IV [Anaerohalosphaeraceae bacterium]HRT23716.1 aminotransferase class IV [Anaerohalosphaeraceae bacterium]